MSLRGWWAERERRAAEKYVAAVRQARAEQDKDVAETVAEMGFFLNVLRNKDVGGFQADTYMTVGCWTCVMPELVTYGPLDMEPNVLTEVMHVYLQRNEYPLDGDEVMLADRRVTLRQAKSQDMGDLCEFTIRLYAAHPELFPDGFQPRLFQVIGNVPPPIQHWEGPPEQQRTVAAESDFNLGNCLNRAKRRRWDSLGFSLSS